MERGEDVWVGRRSSGKMCVREVGEGWLRVDKDKGEGE